jgi:hypothetical protein
LPHADFSSSRKCRMLEIANACSCLGKAGSFSHCKSAGILQVA